MAELNDWEFVGTSSLSRSGATGTGAATIPKDVTDALITETKDYAVFQNGDRVMLVPRSQVSV
jgi:hypothetical protein